MSSPVPRRPMTDEERRMAEALGACRFTPGSWDKRFARSVAALARESAGITSAQAEHLRRMVVRYRRQIAEEVTVLADLPPPDSGLANDADFAPRPNAAALRRRAITVSVGYRDHFEGAILLGRRPIDDSTSAVFRGPARIQELLALARRAYTPIEFERRRWDWTGKQCTFLRILEGREALEAEQLRILRAQALPGWAEREDRAQLEARAVELDGLSTGCSSAADVGPRRYPWGMTTDLAYGHLDAAGLSPLPDPTDAARDWIADVLADRVAAGRARPMRRPSPARGFLERHPELSPAERALLTCVPQRLPDGSPPPAVDGFWSSVLESLRAIR